MPDWASSRRAFLRALGLGALTVSTGATGPSGRPAGPSRWAKEPEDALPAGDVDATMLGAYGTWAADLAPDPPLLSLRRGDWRQRWDRLADWREEARSRLIRRIAPPVVATVPVPEPIRQLEHDGLHIEVMRWPMPYGPPVEGVLLKPAGSTGPLPGVLALHDHAGDKWHGWRKVADAGGEVSALIRDHWSALYSGRPWANALARRGFVVLAFDGFGFGSRRVRLADVPASIRGDLPPRPPETPTEIRAYNRWAGEYESIFAKSLFSAGTTWPGVTLADDQAALGVLAARPDVDAERLGCAGLSGGGLRTVYLGGADPRVQAAVCVSMMTTWRDFVVHKSRTHTWMVYPPILPTELEYPEILGLRVPLPTLVQMNRGDRLFTFEETERADAMLRAVFDRAGASDRYTGAVYDGDHAFPRALQEDAFDWLDKWL